MNVDCRSRLEGENDHLSAQEVKAWIAGVPNGATIAAVVRDFGNQRDPEPRLVGLVATWSEARLGDPDE